MSLSVYSDVNIDDIAFEGMSLDQLTNGIRQLNKASFVITGRALKYVKETRLYKEKYKTFSKYVEKEFGVKKTYAYQIIKATESYDILCTTTKILPTCEKQVRYLTPLSKSDQIELWLDLTKDGTIPTGPQVRKAVRKKLHKSPLYSKSYIYIINQTSTNFYKIGVSSDVSYRLKQLQTAAPKKLVVVYSKSMDYAYIMESLIHRLLDKYNTEGEWFEVDGSIIDDVISLINTKF